MIRFRQAEEKDYNSINDFYNRINSSKRSIEQFTWQFHNCPYGPSIYIIGEDEDKIVGTNCVIPIELVTSENKTILTGKSEDTLVDPAYRGQNIFFNLYQVLFEACKENGIKVVWGFTSAYKPFKKLGFRIPYIHQQGLAVNKIFPSYNYLSQLNKKNNLVSRAKILGLCIYSKLKFAISFHSTNIKEYRISIQEEILDNVDSLIQTNLISNRGSFAINQSPDFQKWRIYDNPNYHRVHTYGFYDDNQILKGLIIFNSHPNKAVYISQSTFHSDLSSKVVSAMINYATHKMFQQGITFIRNWHFDHNHYNKSEIGNYHNAGYIVIRRGIGMVWKELDGFELNPDGFHLSRIATQGVI